MRRGLLGLAVLGVAWSGCNLIAGIEEGQLAPSDGGAAADTGGGDVGPPHDGAGGGGGSDSGGGDDTGLDTGTGVDAPVDQGTPVVTCNWANSTPVTVANLQGASTTGRIFDGFTPIAAVGAHSVEIVQQIQGDGNNFHIYIADMQQATSRDFPETFLNPNGRVLRPFHSQAGLAFTSFEQPTAGNTLYVYIVPPTFNGGTALPTPYPISPPGLNGTQFDEQTLEPSTGNDIWVDTFLQNGTTSTYEVDFGQGNTTGNPPTLENEITTVTQPTSFGNGSMLHYNGTAYVALGPNNPGSTPTEIYAVPDSANFTGPLTPIGALGGPGFPFILGAQDSPITPSNYDIMAGVVATDGGLSLQLYGATATGTQLGSLDVSQAPFTPGLTLTATQVPGNSFTWLDDEFIAVGGGFGIDGMNFLWASAAGQPVVLLSDTTRLLQGQTIQEAAVVGASHVGESLGTFYVAWREHGSDDAGTYDILFANELDCVAH